LEHPPFKKDYSALGLKVAQRVSPELQALRGPTEISDAVQQVSIS